MRKNVNLKKRNLESPVLYKPVEYIGSRVKIEEEEVPTFFDAYHIIGSNDEVSSIPYVSIFMKLEQDLYVDNVGNLGMISPEKRWEFAKYRFYHLNNSLVYSLFNSIISYMQYEFEFIEECKIEQLISYFSNYFLDNKYDVDYKNCFLRITYELESCLTEGKPINYSGIKCDIKEITMVVNSYIFDCIYKTFIGYFEDTELCTILTHSSSYIAEFHDKYMEVILQFMMEYTAYYKPADNN